MVTIVVVVRIRCCCSYSFVFFVVVRITALWFVRASEIRVRYTVRAILSYCYTLCLMNIHIRASFLRNLKFFSFLSSKQLKSKIYSVGFLFGGFQIEKVSEIMVSQVQSWKSWVPP
jgi:hypothetical protein